MSGSKEVIDGLNLTPLNGNSDKINTNGNTNFSSVSQALTNACIIVPIVCFVGTVIAVIVGISICKTNRTCCDRCWCLRMFRPSYEETDLTEATGPLCNRLLCRTRMRNIGNQTEQSYSLNQVSTFRGIANPSFDHSCQSTTPELIHMATFDAFGRDTGPETHSTSKDADLNTSDVSIVVNCSMSSVSDVSTSSSRRMYNERIQNFLRDSMLIFHKTYNPAAASVLINKEPESSLPDFNSLETQNTLREDSSFSEYSIPPADGSSLFGIHPCSDVSKIVNYRQPSVESSPQTSREPNRILPPAEPQAGMLFSCDPHGLLESPCMPVPPPSPNTDDSDDSEDTIFLNKNPWATSTKNQDSRALEGTQGTWTTALSAESRVLSLEWDDYQPSPAHNFPTSGTPNTESRLPPLPSYRPFWV